MQCLIRILNIKNTGSQSEVRLYCEVSNAHYISLKAPAHSTYSGNLTYTLPPTVTNGYFLQTNASGVLSWAAVDLTALSATNLTSGTIPDARFPSTLPALNGSALTNLNGSNIASGTIAAARVATLNQDTTGNAATATALETARTIAGVSFDGSANISLNNNAITNGAGYLTSVATSNIADEAVTLAKIEDFSSGRILGRLASGTGEASQLTASSVRSIINVEDGATADQSASEIVALIADQTIAPSTIDMEDNEKILLGASDDLEIFHSGSHSIIKDGGTGNLNIQGSSIVMLNAAGTENLFKAVEDGAVELYFDNAKKAETVTGGFTVTGTCTATAFSGDGSSLTGISAGATGGGSDEIFYENGQNVTTDYTITNGKNAMAAGPITIDSGATVTVGSGETLTIV